MIPLRTDSPLLGTPWTNWILIAVNVIIFLLQQLALPQLEQQFALNPRDPHLYQYLTYQFLHANGLHVGSNMLFLYIFGNNVNDRMGNWGYLAFYVAGGVFAGVAFMVTSNAPVIGASGAVAAVTGAFLVLLPRAHVTILYWFILIGVIEIPSVWFIVFYFVQDFVYGFAGWRSGMSSGVAHTAHVGGSVFGFTVSFALLAFGMLPRDHFDMFALFQRWNRRRQYTDLVRQGFDPFTPAPRGGKAQSHPLQDRIQDLRAQIAEALAHHKVEDAARFYLELHAIDPNQVLSRQNQLDVANQLFAQDVHGAAADAYEGFLKYYPKYEQVETVQLMLGLLYARYLNRPDKARPALEAALQRLSAPREIELARAELARLGQPA
jgi:membrane associated rhomboid family serine protease